MTTTAQGWIRADELYRLDEFKSRMAMNDWAMRQARRKGLLVRRIGRNSYVLGSDAIDFVKTPQKPEAGE